MRQVFFIRVQNHFIISFFNRDEIFFIRRNAFSNNSYNYWISKPVNSEMINKIFLRQELFALKEQFI